MGKKLYVTKKQAIADCKTIWKLVLDKNLLSKREALNLLPEMDNKYPYEGCPLCSYVDQFSHYEACTRHCPYYAKYNRKCWDYPSYEENPQEFAKLVMEL